MLDTLMRNPAEIVNVPEGIVTTWPEVADARAALRDVVVTVPALTVLHALVEQTVDRFVIVVPTPDQSVARLESKMLDQDCAWA